MRRRCVLCAVITLCAALVLLTAGIPIGSAAGETDIQVQPQTATITAGETVQYDIVLTSAANGVGSFEFRLQVDDTTVATIADAAPVETAALANTNISDDGSTLSLDVIGADTADQGSVTLTTVTVQSNSAGDTTLMLSVDSAGDENSESYTVTNAIDGTLSVTSGDSAESSDSGGGGSTQTPVRTVSTTPETATADTQQTEASTTSDTATTPQSGTTSGAVATAPNPETTDVTGEPSAIRSAPILGILITVVLVLMIAILRRRRE